MLGHSRARSFKPLTAAFTQGQRGVVTEPDLQAPNLHYLTCHRKTANPDANDGFQSGRGTTCPLSLLTSSIVYLPRCHS